MSFVLFALLAWSAAGALVLGSRWRRFDRGLSWACLAAGLAVAATALVVRDNAVDRDRVTSRREQVVRGGHGGRVASTREHELERGDSDHAHDR